MKRRMLILFGPQGAGNHLWSKIFSLHPLVYGWKSLLENYWEPHRFNEPFASCWRDHSLLKSFDWKQSDCYFTSISCPLGIPGSDVNPIWNPNPNDFAKALEKLKFTVEFAIIGRDQTILKHQQNRIRGTSTMDYFYDMYNSLKYKKTFLSYELLYLYKSEYLKSLDFNIPIAYDDPRIEQILSDDPNVKYIHNVESYDLDEGNKTGKIFNSKP